MCNSVSFSQKHTAWVCALQTLLPSKLRAGAASQLVSHLLAGRAMTDCGFQLLAQTPTASNEASLAGMKRPCWPLDAANSFLKSGFLSKHHGTITHWQWFPDRWRGRLLLLLLVTSICSGALFPHRATQLHWTQVHTPHPHPPTPCP